MSRCYLCGQQESRKREGSVRDDPKAEILECVDCGLVFLSNVRKDEAFYRDSGMHGDSLLDVETWLGEALTDDQRRARYLGSRISGLSVLDFGCGAGGFLIQARGAAASVAGVELESRLYPHFKEQNLEVFSSLEHIPSNRKFDVITAFHVMEHLEDPATMLKKLAVFLAPGGEIVIEVPSGRDALLTIFKNAAFSRFTYWSCHLYLFNPRNIGLLAQKADLTLGNVEGVQRYPLSNHLYWLLKGKPGGHVHWNALNNAPLLRLYERCLAFLGRTDTVVATLRR